MATPSILNTVSSQIEKVEEIIPHLYEDTAQIAGEWKKTERVKTISNYLYRLPLKLYAGGSYAKVTGHGGVVPEGTSFKLTHMIAGYHRSMRVHSLTADQIDTSASSEQSVINALSEAMDDMIKEAQVDDDVDLHTDGSGKLTNAASASPGATQLTFAGATDDRGVNLLRPGQRVDVWDDTGATVRADGPYTITEIDYASKIVTFHASVTGIQADDLVAVADADVYGPSSLTTESSTWPARGTAAGLGGDSWRHGFKYMNSNTGYYLQIQRSATTQLNAPRVDAGAAGIEFSFGDRIIDEHVTRFGGVHGNLFGIANQAQVRAIRELTVQITQRWISPGQDMGKAADLSTDDRKYTDAVDFCGVPVLKSKRQDFDRIDFVDREQIGRAQLFSLRPYREAPGGPTIWAEVDASTGRRKLLYSFGLECSFDYVGFQPGTGGLISNLAVPSGAV